MLCYSRVNPAIVFLYYFSTVSGLAIKTHRFELCGPLISWASVVAQLVKNPPAMQEIWVRSLGSEDPLEKGKPTQSSILGLENSMDCIVHGVTKSWTRLSDFHFHNSFKDDVSNKS